MEELHKRNIFGVGNGTNIIVELVSLWGLPWFVRRMGLASILMVGDSKVIKDWSRGVTTLYFCCWKIRWEMLES